MEYTGEKTKGLHWIRRKGGTITPFWHPPQSAIKAGWPIRTVNLSESPPGQLIPRCQKLQAEMLEFLNKDKPPTYSYNGTIGSLITLYQTHPMSPYQKLRRSSLMPINTYAAKLKAAHGARLIVKLTGLDVINWHALWSSPPPGKPARLGAAGVALNVLKCALNFGSVCGYKECRELREVLGRISFPQTQPRNQAPTAADVEAAIGAAHKLGRPRAALAYAMQFETSARQWDVIGQWVPMKDERPSAILAGGQKWIGPTWASIDRDMIFAFTPSKTMGRRTRTRVRINVKNCPMIMAELAKIPPEMRRGPLIINEFSGLPYMGTQFNELWQKVRKEAQLPLTLWNRDFRAGGITEGRMANASLDDIAKLAGHRGTKTTGRVYDRDVLVSSNRVAAARAKLRSNKE